MVTMVRPSACKLERRFSTHAFSIHDNPLDLDMLQGVFIAGDDGRQPHSQMLIPAMGGSKQWVAMFIVKQDQSATAKNRSQASNQSTWNEQVAVHRLAVPIDIASQNPLRLACFLWKMPQMGRPMRQSVGQTLRALTMCYLRQKGFGVTIAIRLPASGQQR
jgi:hypothetical protein